MKCLAGWRAGRGVNSDPMSWVQATESLDRNGSDLLKAITQEVQRLLGVT
jgi:hypothetical protein